MAKADAADFLVEVGTEELPPTALASLMAAFVRQLAEGLERDRLAHSGITGYATPRRLAVLVAGLAPSQADRELELKGPPVSVAFDPQGEATPAAQAFADRCGVPVAELGRTKTSKGEWLSCRTVDTGRPAAELLPDIVGLVLHSLPAPRRMRWGSIEEEFVRPVHWILMLHGENVVDASLLGLRSDRLTRGHRFLSAGKLVVNRPKDYLGVLEQAFVVADFGERRQRIVDGVRSAAAAVGGKAIATDELYDEVTALTEWPVPLTGRFDKAFLLLPREVIVATLTSHQRYFPVEDEQGRLMAAFVTVANLESREPDKVRDGNERVIRPRLADAAFFWEQDGKTALDARQEALHEIVYQKGLGSIGDLSVRIASLAGTIASRLQADRGPAERAALLSKCDLLTGMVGEFPELQGIMGRYYARRSGEPETVADAIGEQYLPRFAGDSLPKTTTGQILALADKLDALAGAFCLGKKPSGNRDPFGLRRAAIGIVRIMVEGELDLDLPRLIADACRLQPPEIADAGALGDEIYNFILERLRAYYIDQQGVQPEVFEAVRARRPASLFDFDSRVKAVAAFVKLDAADSLAASNKRIANILRQAGQPGGGPVDPGMLKEDAEKDLYEAILAAKTAVAPLLEKRAYEAVLAALAQLRQAVDRFFDDVMVMTDDERVRQNRLALLSGLRALFLDIADISRLSLG
jgi:glycyl-tRNA synthetase beta chain